MKRKAPSEFAIAADRPRQEAPIGMVNDLLETIRRQFYGDITEERWNQDKYFLKIHVVTWPAAWLDKRGVTLPPARYQQILQDIFNGIKQHGQTGAVTHWPRYLTHCVQQHFKRHGDEYYNEGKSLRLAMDRALSRAEAAVGREPDLVASMAQVHRLMRQGRARAQKPARDKASKQGELGL